MANMGIITTAPQNSFDLVITLVNSKENKDIPIIANIIIKDE